MSKKTSLAAALRPLERSVTAMSSATASRVTDTQPVSPRALSRVGKKAMIGYFDPDVSKQIKRLAIDRDTSVQELLREALNDFFRKNRMSPIA